MSWFNSLPSASTIPVVTLSKVSLIIAMIMLNITRGINIDAITNKTHSAMLYSSVEKSPKAIKYMCLLSLEYFSKLSSSGLNYKVWMHTIKVIIPIIRTIANAPISFKVSTSNLIKDLVELNILRKESTLIQTNKFNSVKI